MEYYYDMEMVLMRDGHQLMELVSKLKKASSDAISAQFVLLDDISHFLNGLARVTTYHHTFSEGGEREFD